MNRVIAILLIITVPIIGTAQSTEFLKKKYSHTVKDRAKYHKISKDLLQQVMESYMRYTTPGQDTLFTIYIEDLYTTTSSPWVVLDNMSKKIIKWNNSIKKCTDNIDCWKHAYFPKIKGSLHNQPDTDRELQDMDGYFKDVPVVKEAEPELINIELGANGFRIKECKNGSCPSDLAKQPYKMPEVIVTEIFDDVTQKNVPVVQYYEEQINLELGHSDAILAQFNMCIDNRNFDSARYHLTRWKQKGENMELYVTELEKFSD